jgi:hypothetical protein
VLRKVVGYILKKIVRRAKNRKIICYRIRVNN